MKLSNKIYDVLKWICTVALPALVFLLGTLLPVYGVADGTVNVVLVTITAVDTFIGALIGISNIQYKRTTIEEVGD